MTLDFSHVPDFRQHPIGNLQDQLPARRPPMTAEGKLLTPKQIRARARRKGNRANVMTDQELDYLYQKPIAEWDLEELAHGRPRNSAGHFRGPKPKWITTAVHEESMQRYTAAVKTEMRSVTVDALDVLRDLIGNDEVDEKGKPLVPPSVRLEATKFLLEHSVGKPTQKIEQDISVKLQGILGQVMVNPAELQGSVQSFMPTHFPGVTMELAEGSNYDDDDEFLPGE